MPHKLPLGSLFSPNMSVLARLSCHPNNDRGDPIHLRLGTRGQGALVTSGVHRRRRTHRPPNTQLYATLQRLAQETFKDRPTDQLKRSEKTHPAPKTSFCLSMLVNISLEELSVSPIEPVTRGNTNQLISALDDQ